MENGSFDERVAVRYLLGDLPEDLLVQVENRAFSDPEYLRVVEAVEADLIDSYVRGELQASERRQFEVRFLASPARRKKVEFARAWARVASESQAADNTEMARSGVPRRSWRDALARLVRGPVPAFQFAMGVVAVVLVSVISWQAVQTTRLRGRVGELEAERAGQQQQEKTLQKAIEVERARADDLSAQLQRNGPTGLASLILMPGMVRGENAPPQLVVPHTAQLAALQVQLEPRDEYPQYRAELHTRRGDEILTRSNLREQRSGVVRVVVLEIPASVLNAGDYELTLKGIAAGKQPEDIAYYRFSVQKK